MNGLTMNEITRPLTALRLVAVDFPTLPAGEVLVSPIYPDTLELSFHDDIGKFEAWRTALGFDPEGVEYRVMLGGTRMLLTVTGDYAGGRIKLTGYSDAPDTGAAGGAA